MKFGTLYAYWGNEWKCDYIQVIDKVAGIGFDVLEISADHLYHMSESDIYKLKEAGGKKEIEFTVNSGPAKENDLASPDGKIRRQGIDYFTKVLNNMKKLSSKTLAGAIYSFWPTDFKYTDKKTAWDNSIRSLKTLSKEMEYLDIECSLEVLNQQFRFWS